MPKTDSPVLIPDRAHPTADPFRLLVESVADCGLLMVDAAGRIVSWNPAAKRITGHASDEMVGQHVSMLESIGGAAAGTLQQMLRQALAEGVAEHEGQRPGRDGTPLWTTVTVAAVFEPPNHHIGFAVAMRDITVLKKREREIARLSRLYDALSQVNQATVRVATRDALFATVCRILVDRGGFRMTWIGWHDPDTRRLVPVAECGDENDYLQSIMVYTDDRPEGRGPSGEAFRSGRCFISNDALADPATAPWRSELERRGFLAVAAFPVRLNDEVCGTLCVYADERGFFHDKEIGLLEEAANELSFALDSFARDAARREAEKMVRNEKMFSDTMIESMPGIVYFYDSDGGFLRWNRNFETVSGYSGDEIARMHPLEFFADEDRSRVEEGIAEVFARGESAVEAPFVARDGTATPHFFTGRRVVLGGKPCLVGVGIDVSARKRVDAEREQRLRAEAADRIKSAFLANMSHELRTPPNSIIGFTGVILQGLAGPLNAEQSKQLDMVRTSARHLLALVNDVLDISKIEAGQFEVAREPFDPHQSIDKVLALVRPGAEAKHLELQVHVESTLGRAVSDQRRFEQILLNLMSNAIKFTDRGAITLAAELLPEYKLPGADAAQPAIRVRISDTGMGIRAEGLETLFQPFRQMDAGLSRNHEGTGLGLAICRRLSGLMGGEVGVRSEWGKGSTFTVTLPLQGPGTP